MPTTTRSRRASIALVTTTFALVAALHADELPRLEVSIDFPSGSGQAEAIDQQARAIRISPTVHPERGWPCWWFFKVTGVAPGETLTIDMGGDMWAQPDQAMFSVDRKQWRHTPPGEKQNGRIMYRQQVDAPEVWFAWGPPFTEVDAAELVRRTADDSPYAEAWTLCQSLEGRDVPALRIRRPGANDADRYGLWIGARQHAWESGGSWVARGLIEWLVSDDPRAKTLGEHAAIVVVPLMDVDNVAIGAGGKNQKPHDHNRDWSDAPRFPAVAAAQREIKRLDDDGRFDLYLDLHNPAPGNRESFFYVPPPTILSAAAATNLERFLIAARTELTRPLPFRGRTVESGADANDPLWPQKSTVWVTRRAAGHVVSTTLEVPWNTPASTPDGYRAAGKSVGLALERYFRQPPK